MVLLNVFKGLDGFAKPVTFKIKQGEKRFNDSYGSIFSSFLTVVGYVCLITFFSYLYLRMYNLEDDTYLWQIMANTHTGDDLEFLDLNKLKFLPSLDVRVTGNSETKAKYGHIYKNNDNGIGLNAS